MCAGYETGSVVDTGQRTPGGRGRGRVGSYYALAGDIGVGLAVSIAPEGIVAECVDAYGDTVTRADRAINRPARPDELGASLRAAAADARHGAGLSPRLAVVSAADPVDRRTGTLIHLPDSRSCSANSIPSRSWRRTSTDPSPSTTT